MYRRCGSGVHLGTMVGTEGGAGYRCTEMVGLVCKRPVWLIYGVGRHGFVKVYRGGGSGV